MQLPDRSAPFTMAIVPGLTSLYQPADLSPTNLTQRRVATPKPPPTRWSTAEELREFHEMLVNTGSAHSWSRTGLIPMNDSEEDLIDFAD